MSSEPLTNASKPVNFPETGDFESVWDLLLQMDVSNLIGGWACRLALGKMEEAHRRERMK